MERIYYEAYDDRYRQVHGENLRWFDAAPSGIVMETIDKYGISKGATLLEIGCGEGRDACFLLKQGFDLLATDVSAAAIAFCRTVDPEHAAQYQVLDCVRGTMEGEFDFIYAVAVVHMLVDDGDRADFYCFIRDHLKPGGIALICSMGDGVMERRSDPASAFDLQERVHEPTGKRIQIASTSYRAVCFVSFEEEIRQNGLSILEQGITDIRPDYWNMMYAIVKKQS